MNRLFSRRSLLSFALALCLAPPVLAQKAGAQKNDEEYTKLIKQNLQDPRITTEPATTRCERSQPCPPMRCAAPSCPFSTPMAASGLLDHQ